MVATSNAPSIGRGNSGVSAGTPFINWNFPPLLRYILSTLGR